MKKENITKIWLNDKSINITTADGRCGYELFESYQPLRDASAQERESYEISPFGIHWPKLEEDLLFDAFCWSPQYG